MNMEDRDGFIWVDGDLVPWRDAKFHVLTHTLHHGLGVFEGLRAYAGPRGSAVFRLQDHTNRLFNSAHILGMTLPYDRGTINEAHLSVMRANGFKECYFRPIAFYGGENVGVSASGNSVHVAVIAWPWADYHGKSASGAGIRLKTSSFCRLHHNSVFIKAKACGHYINSMMANMEAKASGHDDALLLDAYGYVAEASTSTIFVIRDGAISTPQKTSVLEGITRDTILVLAGERDLRVSERNITRDEIYCADEVFVTGTAAEVVPVAGLDGRRIGDGTPGPLTRDLQGAYRKLVQGQSGNHESWLTFL